jgi:hypothetical protein
MVMGICGCFPNSKPALWVLLVDLFLPHYNARANIVRQVCIFLGAITYQLTLGAIGSALGAEVPSLPLRSTTISILSGVAGALANGVSFVSLQKKELRGF